MSMVKYSIINAPLLTQTAWLHLDHVLHEKTKSFFFKIAFKVFHSTCTHTHLNFIYHFFASSTSQNVEQFYSSYFYDWSLQSRLLSCKSESCFNNASSARLIIFSLLLTVSLPFLKVTVAFAFLIKSSIKFTF